MKASGLTDSAARRALRARLCAAIGSVFEARGYLPVDPPILQPASVFLDLLGETLRSETYLFADPDGVERCLRPDLTIATCRLYLDSGVAPKPARLWYEGTIYRHGAPHAAQSGELRQAGIESLGTMDKEAADAEILRLTIEALRAAGVKSVRLKLGDLGLFSAFVDTLDLPEQWRGRLRQHFSRPDDFARLLGRLSRRGEPGEGPRAFIAALGRLTEAEARAVVQDVLLLADIQPVGGRSAEEIAERFLEQAADASALALKSSTLRLIERFLAIKGPPEKALAALHRLAKSRGRAFSATIGRFERRLDLMRKAGVDLGRVTVETSFVRAMGYYTGFIFALEARQAGSALTVASGGRYDRLLMGLGAKKEIPAAGAAIFLDPLMQLNGSAR